MKRSLVFIILLGLLTMMTTHALGEIGEAEFKAKLSKQRARMRPDGEYHHGKVKYVYQEGTSAEMTENLEVSDRSIRELHKVQVVKGPVNLSDLGDLEIDQTNQFQRLENVLIIEGPVTSPQELNLGTIDVGKQSHLRAIENLVKIDGPVRGQAVNIGTVSVDEHQGQAIDVTISVDAESIYAQ